MDVDTTGKGRPSRPRWSLSEASKRTGVSRTTLLRRIEAGKIPGAIKTDEGWSIGIEDLIGAGIIPDKPSLSGLPEGVRGHGHPDFDHVQRIADLERELAVAHAQRAAAEQVAVERERIIQSQAVTLLILQPKPVDDRPSAVADAVPEAEHHPPADPGAERRSEPDNPLTWLRRQIFR
ncbi:hypothetical protein [Rhodococcus sp. BH5]|uniref:hypothetical protein n=1 Tax=Rhodococcus sp. BH5 TaxID=2871702 RepID=UPI0022CD3AC3|nr:hypothetical protein [Rhodococcus sp. BH5]MCZ9635325.1 hypothetical protein [Rhodococcus sp. BH5]